MWAIHVNKVRPTDAKWYSGYELAMGPANDSWSLADNAWTWHHIQYTPTVGLFIRRFPLINAISLVSSSVNVLFQPMSAEPAEPVYDQIDVAGRGQRVSRLDLCYMPQRLVALTLFQFCLKISKLISSVFIFLFSYPQSNFNDFFNHFGMLKYVSHIIKNFFNSLVKLSIKAASTLDFSEFVKP